MPAFFQAMLFHGMDKHPVMADFKPAVDRQDGLFELYDKMQACILS